MTSRTVALGVTRDAGVEIAHRFPRVMVRSARTGGEFVRRRMKSSPRRAIAGSGIARDADATMAISAERLKLMATDASGIVLTSTLRMHREPVVGVHIAWTNASVVTIRALVLGVTTAAEGTVVCRNGFVSFDEVSRVRRVVHPLRWNEFARGECRDHATVALRRVTRDARALRSTLRRATHVVTREAPRHAR